MPKLDLSPEAKIVMGQLSSHNRKLLNRVTCVERRERQKRRFILDVCDEVLRCESIEDLQRLKEIARRTIIRYNS